MLRYAALFFVFLIAFVATLLLVLFRHAGR